MESNTYPGSYYQPLFDLLNQEHGIIPLESEMTDIIVVVEKMRGKQPGPRWVKASERLPGWDKFVKWRKGDEERFCSAMSLHCALPISFGDWEWLDESAAGREDWISVDERPLIKRDGEWWELTEDGEQEFIAAVPYHDTETDDPKKDRWWIRHCYIDGEGFLYVKCDNEMDEDVASWNVSNITHWRPLPEPPKRKQ